MYQTGNFQDLRSPQEFNLVYNYHPQSRLLLLYAGFFFIMQTLTFNIIPALLLVIPCHGIFLSVFFLIKSRGNFTSNFFMGLLLLALSLYSLRQFVSHMNPLLIPVNTAVFDPPAELLLCPFLFLYTASLIRPQSKHKIRFHLLVIIINLLLLFLSGFAQGLLGNIVVASAFVINGGYLLKTICLFIRLIKAQAAGWSDVLFPDYSLIVIINLLMFVNILLAALCPMICTLTISYMLQLPKGILVFYLYYLILQKSDLSMGSGNPES